MGGVISNDLNQLRGISISFIHSIDGTAVYLSFKYKDNN